MIVLAGLAFIPLAFLLVITPTEPVLWASAAIAAGMIVGGGRLAFHEPEPVRR